MLLVPSGEISLNATGGQSFTQLYFGTLPTVTEDDLQTHRRARLKAWLKEHGGAKRVCERRGLSKNTQSQISQMLHGYSFAVRAARTLETKLGIEPGYLDDTGAVHTIGLSPEALGIARWFDRLTDPKDRNIAETGAMAAILRVLQRHDLLPSGAQTSDSSQETPPGQPPPHGPQARPAPAKTRTAPAARSQRPEP